MKTCFPFWFQGFPSRLGPITLGLGQGNIAARVSMDMCGLPSESQVSKRCQEFKMPANRSFRQRAQQAQESDPMGYGLQNHRGRTTQTLGLTAHHHGSQMPDKDPKNLMYSLLGFSAGLWSCYVWSNAFLLFSDSSPEKNEKAYTVQLYLESR